MDRSVEHIAGNLRKIDKTVLCMQGACDVQVNAHRKQITPPTAGKTRFLSVLLSTTIFDYPRTDTKYTRLADTLYSLTASYSV